MPTEDQPLRAVLVCVEYADLLSVTIPYNAHHFSEILIVTSLTDHETHRVYYDLRKTLPLTIHMTGAFYHDGAIFNKFRALEEALDTHEYRKGWLCVMDADILWPTHVDMSGFKEGNLYVPPRRIVSNPEQGWSDRWEDYPVKHEREFAGYSQIFHASDSALGNAPWHDIRWSHAGGADSFFQMKWPDNKKIRPDFTVLHLGEPGINWCGRSTPYLDGSAHPDSVSRRNTLNSLLSARRNGPDKFANEKLK